MPFVKGHKLATGRPKGSLNDPDLASLRVMLENAFVRNQSAAIKKIDDMFQGSDLKDFKWICEIKASLEPKKVEHSGSIKLSEELDKAWQRLQMNHN